MKSMATVFDSATRVGHPARRSHWKALAAALLLIALTGTLRPAAAQDTQQQDTQQQGSQQQDANVPAPSSDVPPVQAMAADPPSRVARLSLLMGNVSLEPASVNQFSAAEVNDPLTSGDRVYTDAGAIAELQTGSLAVRLGQQTDLTVQAMTDTLAQFGLAQGELHLRSFALQAGTPSAESPEAGSPDARSTLELDTPNVAVTVLQPGDVRVDVDPNSDTTTVWLLSGQVQVDGNGLQQVLAAGQRVRLVGSDPVAAQWLDPVAADGLDDFSAARDEVYESALAAESAYVNPGTIGFADLAGSGDWQMEPDLGAVWYPSGVAVGWVPYSCGRWAWVAPWGWTWVGCRTWGFAPFHYGRWKLFDKRWGWIPGPPVLRPIYSPALVAFVGGRGWTAGGAALTGWFPLGPGEPYRPWYHASPLYVNRLNASGIYTRDTAEARRIYSAPEDAYGVSPDSYVNRSVATVAMPQASFAAGRPVLQAAVHPGPQQLARAEVLAHPLITPERSAVVPAPAPAVPAHLARPGLAFRPSTGAPGSSNLPGAVAAQSAPVRDDVRPPSPALASGSVTAPAAGAPPPSPLYHRAVPPVSQPSFEQQHEAIQSTDPGRPLGPQQVINLQKGQPAGPESQHEAPHPSAAPKPAPRPAPPSRPK